MRPEDEETQEAEVTYEEPLPEESDRVWWWSLNRDGNLIDYTDPEVHMPRHSGSPPLKDGSPYTPSEYDHDDVMLPTHLHVKGGMITGIHGEADLAHLRLTLKLCLRYEALIVEQLSGRHRLELILLKDVLPLIHSVR